MSIFLGEAVKICTMDGVVRILRAGRALFLDHRAVDIVTFTKQHREVDIVNFTKQLSPIVK